MKSFFLALSITVAAFGQYTGGGGGSSIGCTPTGSLSNGYVITATSASACQWQAVGGASVDANTIKNAHYISDVGSANAVIGTTTTAFPGAYATGQSVWFVAAATNTGATTININSLGNKNLTKAGATTLAAGNKVSGVGYLAVYDGTQFQLVGYTQIAADIPTLSVSQVTGAEQTANKDAASGYAGLDSGTKLKTTELPSVVIQTGQSNTVTTGTQDFSGATHTLPAVKGLTASKPATCTIGELYFATDATAGQNVYNCTATNTWTQQTTLQLPVAVIATNVVGPYPNSNWASGASTQWTYSSGWTLSTNNGAFTTSATPLTYTSAAFTPTSIGDFFYVVARVVGGSTNSVWTGGFTLTPNTGACNSAQTHTVSSSGLLVFSAICSTHSASSTIAFTLTPPSGSSGNLGSVIIYTQEGNSVGNVPNLMAGLQDVFYFYGGIEVGKETQSSYVLGNQNVAVGAFSLNWPLQASNYNVAVGYSALGYEASGNYDTAIGASAGSTANMLDPQYSTFLGANTNSSSVSPNYRAVVGAGSTGYADNSVTLGRDTDTTFTQRIGGLTHTLPTIVAGVGAGTSPTVTLVSPYNDIDGGISVVAGTLPSTGVIATLTFGIPAASGGTPVAPNCGFHPANANSALLASVTQVYPSTTSTTLVINSGSSPLTASTTYTWVYHCFQ